MHPSAKVALIAFGSTALVAADGPPVPGPETYRIQLSGQAETDIARPTGETADLDASGLVIIAIYPIERQVCFDFDLSGFSAPMMAHIQQARSLRNGPPVVALFAGTGSDLAGCTSVNAGQLTDMIANPSNYYVSVATTGYPDGALRGRLSAA